jgi:hypothetical protein
VRIVTKVAFAVVLLAAAVLKARQFLFEPTVGDASGWYTRIHLGLVARGTVCRNNLRQVAIACETYHVTQGNYPPGQM